MMASVLPMQQLRRQSSGLVHVHSPYNVVLRIGGVDVRDWHVDDINRKHVD